MPHRTGIIGLVSGRCFAPILLLVHVSFFVKTIRPRRPTGHYAQNSSTWSRRRKRQTSAPKMSSNGSERRQTLGAGAAAQPRPPAGSSLPLQLARRTESSLHPKKKVLRAKGLERRAFNLPPEDQRRMALVFSAYDRFANSFGALAIDTILERRVPSRSAVTPRSPSHLPHALHQPTTQVK